MAYETINGTVVMTTEAAIKVEAKNPDTEEYDSIWIPRSQCQDGDTLAKGDTDICVKDWFLEQKDPEETLAFTH